MISGRLSRVAASGTKHVERLAFVVLRSTLQVSPPKQQGLAAFQSRIGKRHFGSLSSLAVESGTENQAHWKKWLGVSAAFVSVSVVTHSTSSEPNQPDDDDDEQTQEDAATMAPKGGTTKAEEEEEEEDPYANLPEEDEPTECSMCNTFRQGPCRPYWRKLERCFKDHEGEENGAQKCMRYFMSHQNCLMKFTNLYNLVRLTSLQEYIDETETSLPSSQRRQMDMPPIDWCLWRQFEKDAGPNYRQNVKPTSKDTPLWKRFPENTEPVVLTFSTQIPRQDASGLLLRFAYILDQDDMVLGVESNPLYRKLKDQVEGRVREENAADEEDTESGPNMNLDFYVVPSVTRKLRVKAMYAKDPTTPGSAGEGRDDVLKESALVGVGEET